MAEAVPLVVAPVLRAASVAVAAALVLVGPRATRGATVVPAQPGDNVLYSYTLKGPPTADGQLWVVRALDDTLTLSVSPAGTGTPAEFALSFAPDGTLRAAPHETVAAAPSDAAGGDAASAAPDAADAAIAREYVLAVDVAALQPANAATWSGDVTLPNLTGAPGTAASPWYLTAHAAGPTSSARTIAVDGGGQLAFASAQDSPARGKRAKAGAAKAVAADATLHLQLTVRGGALASAQGQTTIVAHANKTQTLSRYTWRLATGP